MKKPLGRPALAMPTVDWKLRIPQDIAVKIDMICLDPLRGCVAYGERSKLVTRHRRAAPLRRQVRHAG
jgi:hypothetical protein